MPSCFRFAKMCLWQVRLLSRCSPSYLTSSSELILFISVYFSLFHSCFPTYVYLVFSRRDADKLCPVLDHAPECMHPAPCVLETSVQLWMHRFLLIGCLIPVWRGINITEQRISRSALTRCHIICFEICRKIKVGRHRNSPYLFRDSLNVSHRCNVLCDVNAAITL
jgi:hypothetical protein